MGSPPWQTTLAYPPLPGNGRGDTARFPEGGSWRKAFERLAIIFDPSNSLALCASRQRGPREAAPSDVEVPLEQTRNRHGYTSGRVYSGNTPD
eukprot:7073855-Alexandrium_andersonii.AAC.1